MNSRKLTVYILLSFGISWIVWLPNVLAAQSEFGWEHSNLLHLLGGLGPLCAAVFTTLIFDGLNGLKDFVNLRYTNLPNIKWLVLGLFMPIIFFLIPYLFLGFVEGQWLDFSLLGLNSKLPFQHPLLIWLLWCLCYGLGEESGWRGYLFPAFTQKYSARISAGFVALIWASWHIPIFFYDKDFMRLGFGGTIGWILGLFAGSIVLSWLLKQSKWNLVPVILWHGTFNFFTSSDQIDFMYPVFISTLVMVLAAFLWIKNGKQLTLNK